MSSIKLTVRASDVAACIGKNKYKKPHEVLEFYVSRYKGKEEEFKLKNYVVSQEEVEQIKNKFNNVKYQKSEELVKQTEDRFNIIKNIDDKEERIKKLSELNKDIITNISKVAIDEDTSEKRQEKKEKILNKVSKLVKDSSNIKKEISSHINKEVGIKNEEKNINNYEKITNTKVDSRNEKCWFMTISEEKDCKLSIVGKIDGKTEDDVLIESKNRQNRLFRTIPIYEKVQMEIYLRMMGLKDATLIENYNNQQLSHDYSSNDILWTEITDGLVEFRDLFLKAII